MIGIAHQDARHLKSILTHPSHPKHSLLAPYRNRFALFTDASGTAGIPEFVLYPRKTPGKGDEYYPAGAVLPDKLTHLPDGVALGEQMNYIKIAMMDRNPTEIEAFMNAILGPGIPTGASVWKAVVNARTGF